MKTAMKAFLYFIQFLALSNCAARFSIINNEPLRETIIRAEESLTIGGGISLNPKELQVNEILMKLKKEEVQMGIEDSANYVPGMHFIKVRPAIEKSKLFRFIKSMPKGSNLHIHPTAGVSSEWMIKNVTYRTDVKMCQSNLGVYLFKAFDENDCSAEPESVPQMREKRDPAKFDEFLERQINLYTPLPEIAYPSINTVWNKFENMFDTVDGVVSYEPIFRDYFHQLLLEHYEDNVMYIEMRSSFSEVYSKDGVAYSTTDSMKILLEVIENFTKQYPDFLGVKGIYAGDRKDDATKLATEIQTFQKLQAEFPDFIVGFDLVGQEELGHSLHYHMPLLLNLSETTRFYFHAGETNFFGTEADMNLVDAILLNTTRIGHGYSLIKHPILLNLVKTLGIAVEISPISNQVLKLTTDLRNHPGLTYNSMNIPIVIVNDDPGFFNTKGLSYDFYYAFMTFTSSQAGLQSLKQFVWNSVTYSALTPEERIKAHEILQRRWDVFLDAVIAGQVV